MKPRSTLTFGYGFLLNVAKVAGAISLVYGATFGIFQYLESKQDKRIEQSLSLFRQFNNAPFTEYRKNVNAALLSSGGDLSDAAADEGKLTEAQANIVHKGKIETDLVFLVDFFDGVAYCAAKNICDPNISYDLFYARGRELYATFYQYIKAQRNTFTGNDFGVGLETLVTYKAGENKAVEKAGENKTAQIK
jgi:hypothetical protein